MQCVYTSSQYLTEKNEKIISKIFVLSTYPSSLLPSGQNMNKWPQENILICCEDTQLDDNKTNMLQFECWLPYLAG